MRNYDKWHIFIKKILKCYNPRARISQDAKDLVNQIINQLCCEYIKGSIKLCAHAKRKTIDSTVIIALSNIWLVEKDIMSFAYDTWEKYSNCQQKNLKKQTKAGLCIPPSRVHSLFNDHKKEHKIGETASIFLAAIVEKYTYLLLEHATKISCEQEMSLINAQHVYLGIQQIRIPFRAVVVGYEY